MYEQAALDIALRLKEDKRLTDLPDVRIIGDGRGAEFADPHPTRVSGRV